MTENPVAEAKPTKSLILDHLTADIELTDAIIDLIDNSVDGIKRTARSEQNLSRFFVKVAFDDDGFQIEDNCGGMDAAVARDYAFRFGRPAGRAPEHGLLGVYGVGMKRALLKMGNYFSVESHTATSAFSMHQDLNKWREEEDNWRFPFDKFQENTEVDPEKIGTKIEVSELFPGIALEFQDPLFENDLIKRTAKAHRAAVSSGLRITVNNKPLQTAAFSLLSSLAIQPAYREETFNGKATPVNVLLYAGISDSRPKEAGWYVFCNGRMVLEADQTSRTVWGGDTGDVNIPKIHNQFSRFRGFAFFDSDDQLRLPWTSTKSGINQSSDIYRKVRRHMIDLSRPVITFLNELDAEKEGESSPRLDAVKAAEAKPLHSIDKTPCFFDYKGSQKVGPEIARITFSRPKKQVDKAKDVLGATSNKEVGESVFDYWYKYEVGKR